MDEEEGHVAHCSESGPNATLGVQEQLKVAASEALGAQAPPQQSSLI
jgi:hypothetical protein